MPAGGIYTQLQQHVGKMTARKWKKLVSSRAREEGVIYRRLTREEIVREYPPERCAAILAKCKANQQAMYTELMQL